eukprot:6774659-Prymnesium_polylepis.1
MLCDCGGEVIPHAIHGATTTRATRRPAQLDVLRAAARSTEVRPRRELAGGAVRPPEEAVAALKGVRAAMPSAGMIPDVPDLNKPSERVCAALRLLGELDRV